MSGMIQVKQKCLLKDVKHIARNDGNLIGIVLHVPHSEKLWSELGGLLDKDVTMELLQLQGELDL